MPDLGWWEVLARLALAGALGGAIGFERELRDHEAGFRTHLLVAVGSAAFTLVSAYGFRDFQYGRATGFTLDPTRIAAQIVTGIGFLGAGAIIRQGASIRGLTTAATLWVVASIGLASGAGYYSVAVLGTAVVLFALYPLRVIGRHTVGRVRRDQGQLIVELGAGGSASALLGALEERKVRVRKFEIEDAGESRLVSVDAVLPSVVATAGVVDEVKQLDDVRRVEWQT
ncbi:MAG TPA: MgtC/SapB family protein [Gaiellaceae bacterium]|nr:MgtC/SapB family protein [Gaiellaceae bacterium]